MQNMSFIFIINHNDKIFGRFFIPGNGQKMNYQSIMLYSTSWYSESVPVL